MNTSGIGKQAEYPATHYESGTGNKALSQKITPARWTRMVGMA